jgi:biotin transport system substrate-specific component
MIPKNNAVDSKFLIRAVSSDLFWIFSFTILTAIAAQISIPVKPVPFTVQTLMVGLSGAFLGARKGAYSQLVYLALGSIGLPVFADGSFGLSILIGPTGGYLLAFPLAAFLSGYIVEKNKSYLSIVSAMLVTETIIIFCGIIYLNALYLHDWIQSLKAGAIIFSLWTVIKVIAGATIYSGVHKNRTVK